jgi:hypothetical protein
LFPALTALIHIELAWPVIILVVAGFLLLLGLLIGVPEMAVPACIIAGIGGILYYQNNTGDWESWEFLWTLIPGFVGVGILLSALLGGKMNRGLGSGLWAILVSLVLFAIFSSIFGRAVFLGPYWPVLLILLGVIVFIRALFRRRTD